MKGSSWHTVVVGLVGLIDQLLEWPGTKAGPASFAGSEPPLEGIVCVPREKKGRTVGDVKYPSDSGFGATIFLKTESCKK